MSYMELLIKLKEDIKADTIPQNEKSQVLGLISRLEDMLWKYSH